MKLSLTILLVAAAFVESVAPAGPYSVSWYQIAGSGGTSTGTTFTVTGTMSQPDGGGVMTGQKYAVTGGYGSLVSVVQSQGAPLLSITLAGNGVKISWPYPSAGWTLLQGSAPAVGNWTADSSVSSDGTNNYVILTAAAGNLFFRLYHP